MNHILLLFFLCFAFSGFAQEVEFLPSDWENPAVFEKGQSEPHAFHIPFATADAALRNLPHNCANYRLLNGQWKFMWVETPDEVPENFWENDFDVWGWDEIKVPANWQMEGYGHPKFRNIALSFENNPPNIPDYYNPTGCYKRKFIVLDNWQDKEVMLRFEGIKSAAYIWVNGKRVGYNQGGFEPAEFNITPFIENGENDLAVQVFRFSDGSYLENQDMWRLSGIFRDVKLYAQPKVFIHDFFVVSDLDEEYKNATLTLDVDIRSKLTIASPGQISINVFTDEGLSVLTDGAVRENFIIDSMGAVKVKLTSLVIDPPKWSAEFPELFTLLVQLQNNEGNLSEAFTQKIGFREVEYRDHILTVNGVPVKLNGVNSHMHHPEHGQAVPLETLRQDLLLMKQHNINCVRTSHYPPSPAYLDLADELGIYIVDEVGDEAHNNTQLSDNKEWTEMYRDRARKLVYRDRNHPSVIMWSAGNESGSGQNIHEVIKTGKAIDPSRPAWMYGGNTFYIPFEDIVGPRYWAPVDYKNLARGKVLPPNDRRASFMDEYLAATGNGLGGMDEYWEYIWRYPRLTGGAIWDWISPGIKTSRWTVADHSVNNINGQIMGRPVFQQGAMGWGLEFSGHDDWVEFYRHPKLDISGNQLAIGFWVKPRPIEQTNVFVAKGKHAYGLQMANEQTLEFYVSNGERISAKAKVPDNFYDKWHQVVGICNGRSLQLYLDGKNVANAKFSGNIQSSPFPLCIGREAETQDQGEYSGRMSCMVFDELKMFDKAVSIDEFNKLTTGDALLHLNFEEDEKTGDFWAVGLGGRTYGVVWPDRTAQPELKQMKRSGQPVKMDAVDIENGVLKITNRHHFKNLNQLEGIWQILVDGQASQRGFFSCDIAAGEAGEVQIEYRRPRIEAGTECLLEVSFVLKEDQRWAARGYEIAWEQFKVPTDFYFVDKEAGAGKVSFTETKRELVVKGNDFHYVFDKNTGQMISLNYKGTEYLDGPPQFNIWRAPLANDVDPWGSYMFSQSRYTPGLGRSIDNQIRTLGMCTLIPELEKYDMQQLNNKELVLSMVIFSNTDTDPAKRKDHWFFSSAFQRNETWTIAADGSIQLEQEIIPHGPMPDMLPKVGMQFQLPKSFKQVQWYGRGPFENYPDRKSGAKMGLYQSSADSMYVPYLMPQDYGNRCDVHWLKVQNDAGNSLLVKASKPINFSLHKYTTDNLSRAMYTYQLQEAANTLLNIDAEVSGVGGTAIRQLQKYRVQPSVKKYSFSIQPF